MHDAESYPSEIFFLNDTLMAKWDCDKGGKTFTHFMMSIFLQSLC